MNSTQKRIISGKVQRDSAEKTGVLLVERLKIHPKYKRSFKRSKKFLFHDQDNKCKTGDNVEIIESRRFSKKKSWRLLSIKQ